MKGLPDNPNEALRRRNPHLYGGTEPVALKAHTANAGSVPACEADLHDELIALCRANGWYYVHSRMDMPTTCAVGAPDFVIALPNGRTVWLECKGKGKKATVQQNAAIAHLKHLGHTATVVWTLDEAKMWLMVYGTGDFKPAPGSADPSSTPIHQTTEPPAK